MSTPTPYRIALVQMACGTDPDENLRRAEAFVREAAGKGARVVCLPELFRSRYFCQQQDPAAFDLAEPVPGPTTRAMGNLAAETGVVLLAPVFEKRAEGVFHNSLAVLSPDGTLAGLYRKMHIPHDPQFEEKYYFTPGDKGFLAVDTPCGKIGPLICWDQWYPEAARLTALRGAHILVYPTAIGWLPEERDTADAAAYLEAWRTVQRGHAVANGVYVAAVNRTGFEETSDGSSGIHFWGRSFIADPLGTVLAEAPENEEAVLLADVDPGRIAGTRRTWPFLRDRRIDAYEGIRERVIEG